MGALLYYAWTHRGHDVALNITQVAKHARDQALLPRNPPHADSDPTFDDNADLADRKHAGNYCYWCDPQTTPNNTPPGTNPDPTTCTLDCTPTPAPPPCDLTCHNLITPIDRGPAGSHAGNTRPGTIRTTTTTTQNSAVHTGDKGEPTGCPDNTCDTTNPEPPTPAAGGGGLKPPKVPPTAQTPSDPNEPEHGKEANDDEAEHSGAASDDVSSATPRGGVYTLRDEAGNVVRTGRTNDLAARQAAHANDPVLGDYQFNVEYRTDVYAEQRGLEEVLYNRYPNARVRNGGFNKIRAIGPSNPNFAFYMRSAAEFLARQGGG